MEFFYFFSTVHFDHEYHELPEWNEYFHKEFVSFAEFVPPVPARVFVIKKGIFLNHVR